MERVKCSDRCFWKKSGIIYRNHDLPTRISIHFGREWFSLRKIKYLPRTISDSGTKCWWNDSIYVAINCRGVLVGGQNTLLEIYNKNE